MTSDPLAVAAAQVLAAIERMEPCPFCGARATEHKIGAQVLEGSVPEQGRIVCLTCGATGPVGVPPPVAVPMWNTRTMHGHARLAHEPAVQSNGARRPQRGMRRRRP